MYTKFGTAVGVTDKVFGDQLTGVDSVGGRKLPLLLTKPVAVEADTTAQPVIIHPSHTVKSPTAIMLGGVYDGRSLLMGRDMASEQQKPWLKCSSIVC